MNKTIFASILCVFSFLLQANPIQTESISNVSLLDTIINHEQECVLGYGQEDDLWKIHLKHEMIVATDHGLFLSLNNALLPLPSLQSDADGCFLRTRAPSNNAIGSLFIVGFSRISSRGPCPNCGQATDGNGVCHNGDCYFDGIQVIRN